MSFWGALGTGLMDFGGSALGQTAIGAGLGYGADRLMGGDGKSGALMGGLGGALNFGSGSGSGNYFGEGTSDFGTSALGRGFGLGGNSSYTGINGQVGGNAGQGGAYGKMMEYAPTGTPSDLAIRQVGESPGFLGGYGDKAMSYADKYSQPIESGLNVYNAYGNYQSQREQSQLNNEQMDLLRRQNQLAEDAYNSDVKRRAALESQAGAGFSQSTLGSSNYYDV